ncbi:hypothetical protein [Gemelliphila palaticanis]|nr:hypothetical protein [Gemella palaticanis]
MISTCLNKYGINLLIFNDKSLDIVFYSISIFNKLENGNKN